jgi:hypothetical protein
MKGVAASLTLLLVGTVPVDAHHAMFGPRALSASCGWMDADTTRDLANLSTFCADSVPEQWRVRGATANQERLWLEAPADLLARLRERDPEARTLVTAWLAQWRRITGARGASIVLLRQHVDIATAASTMAGDVIRVR